MPSPIGHALAGIAAGWLTLRPASAQLTAGSWKLPAAFAAAGIAPDLDLLVGAHSGPTHGLGAAMLVGVVSTVVLARGVSPLGRRLPLALALAAAYASHILLDWLGTDTSAPIGIMALWPFSREYYESSAHVFMAISRRYWLPEFWTRNLIALARELVILVPIVAAAVWVSRRQRS